MLCHYTTCCPPEDWKFFFDWDFLNAMAPVPIFVDSYGHICLFLDDQISFVPVSFLVMNNFFVKIIFEILLTLRHVYFSTHEKKIVEWVFHWKLKILHCCKVCTLLLFSNKKWNIDEIFHHFQTSILLFKAVGPCWCPVGGAKRIGHPA